MDATREVRQDGWCVRLDLGPQVLGIEIPEFDTGWGGEYPLLPTPPAFADGPVSAATLLLKAKQFDDGLYAAVELAAQRGAGRFPSKASLLRSLAGLPSATAHAACLLGGISVDPSPDARAAAQLAAEFLADESASKPLGFYAWSEGLSAVFRQDRFLQRPLGVPDADALARAVEAMHGPAYDAWLRLNALLSNPPVEPGLRGRGSRPFLPASRSHEQVLFELLYGDRPVPEGFDLMDELVRRVRSGEVGLEPTEESGWYDHQAWSLEPLAVPGKVPEARRLEAGERYRTHLEGLFRGALALARETHVKQLALAKGGCAGPLQGPVRVRPGLTVEPLPTVYARRAASYRFVRSVLGEAFGDDALVQMHRLTPDGAVNACLADELAAMEGLFDGAAAAARRELGVGEGGDPRPFEGWRANLSGDPDVGRDCRMMVPVFYDAGRRKAKAWAFLGWRAVPADVRYKAVPAVLGVEREAEQEPTDRFSVLRGKYREKPEGEQGPPQVEFTGDRYWFAVPVVAEAYVSRLLDRDEFRSHCDRFETREAILANLA